MNRSVHIAQVATHWVETKGAGIDIQRQAFRKERDGYHDVPAPIGAPERPSVARHGGQTNIAYCVFMRSTRPDDASNLMNE